MKKNVFFILLLALLPSFVVAQSADKVTEMLLSKTVTVEQIAYFTTSWQGLIQEDATEKEVINAFEQTLDIAQLPEFGTALNYKDFAWICTKVWPIKGGLFYSIFKSKRYAFRELKIRGYIQQTIDPYEKISGSEALYIITKCSEENE